ncbi:MAG: hypothetical protein FWG61_07160 [Firmicutes bacterium]|nr:hypothetical protein [Bacillota bacterium]
MKTTIVDQHKSSLGMNANLATIIIFAAMLVVSWIPYLRWVAWAVPLVIMNMEKDSAFVKFQAAQALVLGVASAACSFVLQIFIWILMPKNIYRALDYAMGGNWGIWAFLGTLATIIGLAFTIIEIYLIVTSYDWKQVELPIAGPIATKVSGQA